MFVVESYAAVRRFVFVEGHSRREASRVFGLSRETVGKICRFSLPPGYTRTAPVDKPKLGGLLAVIDEILMMDQTGPVKQRHTAKRIFERLRDEHSFAGGYTIVKDYVRLSRSRGRETFVPLSHPPGHEGADVLHRAQGMTMDAAIRIVAPQVSANYKIINGNAVNVNGREVPQNFLGPQGECVDLHELLEEF